MNKHTKMAIIIAPFLIVGGYIAADYYAQEQDKSKNIFQLSLEGQCDLTRNPCILSNTQLTLTLSDRDGVTKIDSDHPLEEVILSFVNDYNKEIRYKMKSDESQQYWQAKTEASSLLSQSAELKMRLISIVNNGYYFSEFYSRKD